MPLKPDVVMLVACSHLCIHLDICELSLSRLSSASNKRLPNSDRTVSLKAQRVPQKCLSDSLDHHWKLFEVVDEVINHPCKRLLERPLLHLEITTSL